MTSAGKRMSIRIDRSALEQFLKEKAPGMKQKALVAKIGISENGFSRTKGQGHLSLENLSRMSKLFDVNMWNLPFVNDEAYTISFKLTTNNMDLHLRAKMIDQIRGLIVDGIPQLAVRNIVLSDILAGKYARNTESDSEIKSIPLEVPKTTLTHSAVSEAFDEVANSEGKTLGNIISECAEELSENTDARTPADPTDIEKYLRDRERTAAQTLAKSLITHIKQLSTLGYCDRDKAERYKRLEDSQRREIRMKKEFWIWKASQGICKDLRIRENGSLIKDRPWLEAIWFFFDSAILNKDMWQERGRLMIEQLKLENFSGRYSIEKEEE